MRDGLKLKIVATSTTKIIHLQFFFDSSFVYYEQDHLTVIQTSKQYNSGISISAAYVALKLKRHHAKQRIEIN